MLPVISLLKPLEEGTVVFGFGFRAAEEKVCAWRLDRRGGNEDRDEEEEATEEEEAMEDDSTPGETSRLCRYWWLFVCFWTYESSSGRIRRGAERDRGLLSLLLLLVNDACTLRLSSPLSVVPLIRLLLLLPLASSSRCAPFSSSLRSPPLPPSSLQRLRRSVRRLR